RAACCGCVTGASWASWTSKARATRTPRSPGSCRWRADVLRATGRLIRADLAQRPVQAALTGLVVAIAAAALLVTLHLRAVLDEPFNDLMRATNGAHVTLTGPPAAIRRAAARPEVAQASEVAPL